MKEQFYLLVYDRPARFNPTLLHRFIDNDPSISDWWHCLEACYIIKTKESIFELQKKLEGHFNGIMFLVVPTTLDTVGGMLPKVGWDWINSRGKGKPL